MKKPFSLKTGISISFQTLFSQWSRMEPTMPSTGSNPLGTGMTRTVLNKFRISSSTLIIPCLE